jgi:hypothetical protein
MPPQVEPLDKTERLRVGLIVDSLTQPRWVRQCLENILATGVAEFAILVKVEPQEEKSGLLYKLYSRLDRTLFPAEALDQLGIEDLLTSVPKGAELAQVEAANLDVLINFACPDLNFKFAKAAKHGVWFYAFGKAPGLNEVMNKIPTTYSSLKGFKEENEYLIYESMAPTLSGFSVRLNLNTCYWKSAAFAARALTDLHQRRLVKQNSNHMSSQSPTNTAMAQMFIKLFGRAASRAVEKLTSSEQWVLAYRIDNGEFKYLIPEPDHFWADPFPLKVNGKHFIFFEDYVKAAGRAHISVIEVDQSGMVGSPRDVLKLDCHLSYPFVFEWSGDYYMIPETGDRNVVELFRAVSFPFEWQPVKILLEANCPLDATVIEIDDTWWMFVNIQEEGVAVNWDELHLYYADNLLGPWKPHARNPIVSDVRSARPAGRLFRTGNALYRPSQNSSMRYGYGTTISRVTKLSTSEYNEKKVLEILPQWDKNIIGIHTLNVCEDIVVVDCLAKRSSFSKLKLRAPNGPLDLFAPANLDQL